MAEYDYESGDAEATNTYPAQASSLRKGGHILIRGRPCKIKEMNRSQPGKHGHAKLTFVTLDIFTGKKLEYGISSTHNVDVPHVKNLEYTLVNIGFDGFISLMKNNGELKTDIKLPEGDLGNDICKRFDADEDVVVTVQAAMGEEKVISVKASPTRRP